MVKMSIDWVVKWRSIESEPTCSVEKLLTRPRSPTKPFCRPETTQRTKKAEAVLQYTLWWEKNHHQCHELGSGNRGLFYNSFSKSTLDQNVVAFSSFVETEGGFQTSHDLSRFRETETLFSSLVTIVWDRYIRVFEERLDHIQKCDTGFKSKIKNMIQIQRRRCMLKSENIESWTVSWEALVELV